MYTHVYTQMACINRNMKWIYSPEVALIRAFFLSQHNLWNLNTIRFFYALYLLYLVVVALVLLLNYVNSTLSLCLGECKQIFKLNAFTTLQLPLK